MSTPNKYVELTFAGGPKHSLSGYRIIGDFNKDGARHLVLQRPESVPVVQKASRVKRTSTTPQNASNAQQGAGYAAARNREDQGDDDVR